MQSFEWKCKNGHVTWSLLAKLRNEEIVKRREKKIKTHKPSLPLRMGLYFRLWWFFYAVLILTDNFHYNMPLSWVIYKSSLQVRFVGRGKTSYRMQTGLLSLPCLPWSSCQGFCHWLCGPRIFQHFKFLNVLKSMQYNELFLSFMNQVTAIKTNMNAVVIFF